MHLWVSAFLNSGHTRSVRAKRNILGGLLIKGLSVLISLLLVPLTIDYVNPARYGIWLTLSSIVAWLSFFDVGLTQGFRNKFAEAIASEDHGIAQKYVSTTYAILGLIFFGLWLIFFFIHGFINWSSMLGMEGAMQGEISMLALVVFTYFCLQFILRVLTTMIIADQQPAKSSFIDLIGQILALVIVFVLMSTTEGSLIKLGLALCIAPIMVLLAAHIFYFQGEFRRYRPALSKVDFSLGKNLLNLGMLFFFIQIAGLVQYESANIIIANKFGPTEVTSYNIVFKYFGVLDMLFLIFLSPFWSASTEAFSKMDLSWIKNAVKKYNLLAFGLTGLGIVMLLFADDVYRIWLGEGTVHISTQLSIWGFIYFLLSIFVSIHPIH